MILVRDAAPTELERCSRSGGLWEVRRRLATFAAQAVRPPAPAHAR